MEEQQTPNTRRTGARTRAVIQPLANEMGRIPPQAIDAEQAVLGAMLLDKNAVTDTIDILSPEAFYDPKHEAIFGAIKDLFGSSNPIDLLTVTQRLKEKGELELAGNVVYISTLTQRIASVAHVEFHARIISQKYIQREVIKMATDTLRDAYDDTQDVFELLTKAEGYLFGIAEKNMKRSFTSMQVAVNEAITEIEVARKNSDGLSGVPTGFRKLDELTSGWQRSDMIVIAARPAMGKTAFVLSMARNTAVDFNMGVALFSLEMSAVQLVKRLISSESKISAEKLRKGKLEDHEMIQLHQRINKLSKAPIFIDDTPGISVFDLRAKCRRLKMQHNIEMVVIDYLQLMSAGQGKGGNREQEISFISRSIKEIAKELNIPIIALSQLSRNVEQRGGDKKPTLSDLRESGAIEQDADIVGFLYRPEYYKIDVDEDGNSTKGLGTVIIAKHRNGGLEDVNLRFIGEYARFENQDDSFYNQDTAQSGAFNPSSLSSGMTASQSFEISNSITLKSKGWDSRDDEDSLDLNQGDEAPF
jgi:replicative DNA helicase